MQKYILRENVVSDNLLLLADENKIFKGGYKAIIKEYVFNTAWTDKEIIKKFRKLDTAKKYVYKNYSTEETENLIFN